MELYKNCPRLTDKDAILQFLNCMISDNFVRQFALNIEAGHNLLRVSQFSVVII